MLDVKKWFQVSGKYRTVAKLPEGMTGIEALISVTGRVEWVTKLGNAHAGDHYLRCFSPEKRDLSREEWLAYKKAGGTTYMNYAYDCTKGKAERIVEELILLEAVNPESKRLVVERLIRGYGF